MNPVTTWMAITALGDSALLLPMIAWMAICLLLPPARRRGAWRWLIAAIACGGTVMLSKLLFMAWGVRPPGLDYTGFSGHTALAVLVWPALGALLTDGRSRWLRVLAIGLGAALGLAVAISRLALRFHTPSEVLLGAALGTAIVVWFVREPTSPETSQDDPRTRRSVMLGLGALMILVACYGRVFPSQHLLQDIAVWLSGHDGAYARSDRTD
jgi:membrane-associated phospholipid phosphatase